MKTKNKLDYQQEGMQKGRKKKKYNTRKKRRKGT